MQGHLEQKPRAYWSLVGAPMLPAPVPEDDAHLPEGWVSAFDEEHEMYYYYNAATGVSTWDKLGAVVSTRGSER